MWQAASADGASSVRIIARAADSAAFTDPAGHVLRIIAPIATVSSNSELDAFRARCAPLSRACRARKRMRGSSRRMASTAAACRLNEVGLGRQKPADVYVYYGSHTGTAASFAAGLADEVRPTPRPHCQAL